MGPRKTLASRGKRAAEPVPTERRTKFRHDPAQAVPPPESMPQAISTMGNRAVTSGRKIELDFLDREGFRIAEWIRKQHWERFCTLNLPYYPSLVRNFFENLRLGHGSVSSTVKDTLIVLTEEKLSRMLAIPKTGKCFMSMEKKEEALKTVLEKETVEDLGSLLAGQLSVEVRLLHNITSRVFLPKTGRFDWVSEREIVFMHYLMKGEPINLPYLMLTQIKEAAKGKRSCLPYGMIFTLIFSESGINLENEIAKKLLHTDTYNERSLLRMGYFKKDNTWIKKSVSKKQYDSESEEEEEENEEEEEREQEEEEATAPAEATAPEIFADDQAATSIPEIPRSSSAPATQQQATLSSELIDKLSELIDSKHEILVGRINESISQSNQQVTKSYEEIRGDIRDLTLRVDMLEHKQRSQNALHSELIGLRSEFGRMRGAADRVLLQQDQDMSTVLQAVKEMKVGVESMMICLLGSSHSSHGGASTSSRPPPQPTPRPPPHNTSRSRGHRSRRSSTIHNPYSVKIPDDSDTENSE